MLVVFARREPKGVPKILFQNWIIWIEREFLKNASQQGRKKWSLGYNFFRGRNAPKFITLTFLTLKESQELNKIYREKDRPTDILSFESVEPDGFGELAFCRSIIRKQAIEHCLSLRDEYLYLFIHGVLHLMGFEHETNARDAKKMFDIQDLLFETLCAQSVPDRKRSSQMKTRHGENYANRNRKKRRQISHGKVGRKGC